MTDLRKFLADLHGAGLRLRVEGGQLLVSPGDRITPDLAEAIRQQRDALVALAEEGAVNPFAWVPLPAVLWAAEAAAWDRSQEPEPFGQLSTPGAEVRPIKSAPEGVRLVCLDPLGRTCKPQEADRWTWIGAPRWYRTCAHQSEKRRVGVSSQQSRTGTWCRKCSLFLGWVPGSDGPADREGAGASLAEEAALPPAGTHSSSPLAPRAAR